MLRATWFASVLAVVAAADLSAQPFPGRFPPPLPAPPRVGIEGVWYFRGDPFQPASVQTQWGPGGPQLVFVNEKGTPAVAFLHPSGRRVDIPEWGIVGRVYPNRIIWPNGDFWAR
jgi:hypothetical protein